MHVLVYRLDSRGPGRACVRVVLTLRATDAATIEDTARIDRIDRRILNRLI